MATRYQFAGQTGGCEPGGIDRRSQCAGVRENFGAWRSATSLPKPLSYSSVIASKLA